MTEAESALLNQLAEVRGQLSLITQMMQANQASIHQRIDDLRHSLDGRLEGAEERIGELEKRERDTAIRSAGSGALSGAIVSAGLELIRHLIK